MKTVYTKFDIFGGYGEYVPGTYGSLEEAIVAGRWMRPNLRIGTMVVDDDYGSTGYQCVWTLDGRACLWNDFEENWVTVPEWFADSRNSGKTT